MSDVQPEPPAQPKAPQGPPPNLLERFYTDGRSHDHIPPLPPMVFGLRVAQVFFALLNMVLCAVSADKLGNSSIDAYEMAFFTFAWTVVFFGYVYGSAIWGPELYHIFIHIGLEALTVLWWLVTFALLASRAAEFDQPRRRSGSNFDVAVGTMQGAAGVGAIVFLLFCATMILLLLHFLRKDEGTQTGTSGNFVSGPQPGQDVEMNAQQQGGMPPAQTSPYPDQVDMPEPQQRQQ